MPIPLAASSENVNESITGLRRHRRFHATFMVIAFAKSSRHRARRAMGGGEQYRNK
jgi:hypothetical protein